jgi:hypothetical protein
MLSFGLIFVIYCQNIAIELKELGAITVGSHGLQIDFEHKNLTLLEYNEHGEFPRKTGTNWYESKELLALQT